MTHHRVGAIGIVLFLVSSLTHADKPDLAPFLPGARAFLEKVDPGLCPIRDYWQRRYRSLTETSLWRYRQSSVCRQSELQDFGFQAGDYSDFSRYLPRAHSRRYPGQQPTHTETGGAIYREHELRLVRGHFDSGSSLTLLKAEEQWFAREKDLDDLGVEYTGSERLLHNKTHFRALPPLVELGWSVDPVWRLLFVAESVDRGLDEPDALSDAWLEVNVNESPSPQLSVALLSANGDVYLTAEPLEHFRLDYDGADSVERYEEAYYALSAIPGARQAFNEREQKVMVYATSESFLSTEASAIRMSYVEADFDQRGALMNYSLFASQNDEDELFNAQFELGLYSGRGFFSNNLLVQDLGGPDHNMLRLDTRYRMDWPESLRSLRMGDTVSFAGSLGNAVRFGGVQWGTDFTTQPGFITFPTPAIDGAVVVPSTVEVFINNARRASEPVPPGPFTISNVPVVTGSGDMRLVITDMFGRERVVTQPFYSSRGLLREGLHEYSYEAGTLREDFGVRSHEYGRGFVAGTHRYGFTPQLTGELRGEWLRDQQLLGTAINWLLPTLGELSLAVAASDDSASGRRGRHAELGFQRQARQLSFGANARGASRYFRRLGSSDTSLPDALQLRGFASLSLEQRGSLTVSYTRLNRRGMPNLDFATLQYTINVGNWGHFRASLFEPFAEDTSRSIGLSLAIPLGGSSLQVNASHQDSGDTVGGQWQRNTPSGPGLGYRLLAEQGPVDRYELDGRWRTTTALFQAQAAELNREREYRLSAEGGVAFMKDRAYWSRRLDQAFAIVEVPELGDVDIYRDNRLLARTNEEGRAIVPGLREYQVNRLRVGDADLPMDIEVSSLEEELVPAYRRGVQIRFDLRRSHWVSFTLYTEDREAVPAGVGLRDLETGEVFPMGLDAQMYLQGRAGPHRYEASWQGRRCIVSIEIPSEEVLFPDLGEQVCKPWQETEPE